MKKTTRALGAVLSFLAVLAFASPALACGGDKKDKTASKDEKQSKEVEKQSKQAEKKAESDDKEPS